MRKRVDKQPALNHVELVCNHCQSQIEDDSIKCASCDAKETDWVCSNGHLNEEEAKQCQDLDCLDEENEEENDEDDEEEDD